MTNKMRPGSDYFPVDNVKTVLRTMSAGALIFLSNIENFYLVRTNGEFPM